MCVLTGRQSLSVRLSQRIESLSEKGLASLTGGIRQQESRKRLEELSRVDETPHFRCDVASDVCQCIADFVDDFRAAVDAAITSSRS